MNPQVIELGFTRVSDFQLAWNLGPKPLKADGIVGPVTEAALKLSILRKNCGQPDLSAHFSAAEFACRCGGRLPGCRKTRVLRDLLASLEQLRTVTGNLAIVSGYRCPAHNKAVSGADGSQHLYGSAADIDGPPLPVVERLEAFAGIGYKVLGEHRVTHVDRRDRSGNNSTGGTLGRPTKWTYPGR